MEVLYQLSYPGASAGLTVARAGRRSGSGMELEPLPVHAPGGVGAEEDDRLGEILGGSDRGALLIGIFLAHLRGLDRVDDDDVGGGAAAGERVGERQGPGLGGGLGGGV